MPKRFHLVPHVAVIGVGISGLFAARTLQDHAIPVNPSDARCFAKYSAVINILECGDWASGSRDEGAFLRGMAAAERILGAFSLAEKTTRSKCCNSTNEIKS